MKNGQTFPINQGNEMDEYGEIQKISKFSLNVLEKPSNNFIVNTLSLAMLDNMVKPGKR